ncbi:MAG: trigger factor [Actinomycetia bacterium]|nr:trigger factor [Actinomycetes bacterium]
MQTTVETLDGNKVRLHVSVPADEFESALNAAFRKLAKEVRIPGFRPGKAPRKLLEARFGPDIAREQALKDSLPEYYVEAVNAERVDPIAVPEIEITSGEEGGDVEFDATVEVRPVATLEGYDSLRIEIPNPAVKDEDVTRQVDMLRDRFADLAESEEPLTTGDYATIDITGTIDDEPIEGLTATDLLYEVGSGRLVEELDGAIEGATAGSNIEFTSTLPEEFEDHGGEEVTFRVDIKDTKKKVLPELTDDWVQEVSEHETVDALRTDIATRVESMARMQAQLGLRDRVLAEAGELVMVPIPDSLVDQEVSSRLEDLVGRLQQQGVSVEQYLSAVGKSQEDFVADTRDAAAKAVATDLALRAVVAQEAIEVSDEELDEELDRIAQQMKEKPAKLRRELERRGAIEAVRSDVARGKALQFLIDHANVVDEEGNPLELSSPPEPGASESQAPEPQAAADVADDAVVGADAATEESEQ